MCENAQRSDGLLKDPSFSSNRNPSDEITDADVEETNADLIKESNNDDDFLKHCLDLFCILHLLL